MNLAEAFIALSQALMFLSKNIVKGKKMLTTLAEKVKAYRQHGHALQVCVLPLD